MGVDVFEVVGVGDAYEEGVIDVNGVDLHVDVEFDVASVLFVGVGGEVDAGDVTEGGFVVGVDFVNSETILEQLAVHQLLYGEMHNYHTSLLWQIIESSFIAWT